MALSLGSNHEGAVPVASSAATASNGNATASAAAPAPAPLLDDYEAEMQVRKLMARSLK
jgi:hypothetical protein